jgi:hypothetical protein
MIIRVLLPLSAFILVLAGLIAIEPPPTKEQLEQVERREMLSQIQSEQKKLLKQLTQLERKKQLISGQNSKIDKAKQKFIFLDESLERLRVKAEKEKQEAQKSIADIEGEMQIVEQKAEAWVRAAYKLSIEAFPPGYLAKVLWNADGTVIAETGKLARDLRATLHISETAAQAAATKVSNILKSRYARRTLVTAAAALATIALLEGAEPVFGWFFDRWWKLLAASAAGLLALGAVTYLQKKNVFE